MAITTTFLEPGTDATQSLVFYTTTSGTVASASDQAHTGSRSLKCSTSSPATNAIVSRDNLLLDSGTQISFYFRTDTLPAGDEVIIVLRTSGGLNEFFLSLRATGKLLNGPIGATAVTGTKVLAVNTWYRICISYYVTNTTTFAFKVYVDAVLDSTVNSGTLTNTGATLIRFQISSGAGANINHWFDDTYIATGGASSSSQPDTGDIRVTAKRPFANGTTNGFTATGTPSGYGSGNAGYVNEQPLSTTNFVSVVAVGATTEEYNIEGKAVGDATPGNIVDVGGWIYAKALLAETASMILNNTTSNVSLTSTITLFLAFAGSVAYPAGTGTDIGIITTALATTVTLYECGVLVAYTPPTSGMLNFF